MPSGKLTSTTASGLRWMLLGAVATFAVQSAYSAVMSRLLMPSDFALLALAMFMLRFVSYFAQGGLSSAIVQRPVLDTRVVRASFTLGIATGLAAYAVLWTLAPLTIASLAAPAELTSVCRVLGLTFVLNAASSTATGLLRRSMRYRTIALIEFVSYVAGYCGLGLTFALSGSGVWSLVYAAIGQAGLMALGSFLAARHDLRPLFDLDELRKVAFFGAKVSFVGFLEFLTISLDTVLVGRYAGMVALGHYNRAQLITALPLHQIGTAMGKVLFPAFSRIQIDHERLKKAYLDSIFMTTLLFVPMAAVIGVVADNLVSVLLGDGWQRAAQLVPLLAAIGALSVIVYFPASVAEATGRVRRKAVIEYLHLAALLLGTGIAVATRAGITSLISAVLVSRLVQHAAYLLWMGRMIPGALRGALNAYAQSCTVAVAVGLVVAGVDRAAGEVAPPVLVLATQFAAAGLAGALILMCGTSLTGIRVARERALIPASLVRRDRRAAACE
ncbi:lipopolysaccharide biosynthesis protein [Streptomyces kurssanovii]|nr:lipopolysaccharide biosynthesis protein [Streptomyces kurssanovii]